MLYVLLYVPLYRTTLYVVVSYYIYILDYIISHMISYCVMWPRIPVWLLRKLSLEPRLLLRRCEDSGPGTHLLEAIRAEPHPETRILQA